MAAWRGGWRVPVVVRPLDQALVLTKSLLLPFAVVVGALATYRTIASSASLPRTNWLLVAGALGVAIAYFALLQTHTVSTRIDLVLARARRRIATGCIHDEEAEHSDRRIACRLTPEVLRAPLFRHDQQHKAVNALIGACKSTERGDYWFVEGRSGSGKTRMALRFVQKLVRDRDLCEIGSRCYLYDFSHLDEVQSELLRRLGTTRHDGAVVLVDNFQLVRPKVLHALTSRLLDQSDASSERLLVFLARPGDAWNLSPGLDVRLLSEAKAAGRHLELMGPRSEHVTDPVSGFEPDMSALLRDLEQDGIASAAELHLAQVIARKRGVPREVVDTLNLLSGSADRPPNLLHVLAIATALAMHRGGFTKRDFARASRVSGHDTLRLRRTFAQLQRVGLVTKVHIGGTRYLFHEAIAELCIDRLHAKPEFAGPFTAVGQARMRGQLSQRDALGAWLVAVEIGAHDVMQSAFDAALSKGAYSRMLQCLKRADARYELSTPVRLQLAILLDRTGEFAESRVEFTPQLVEELSTSSELAAMLASSRIEANHDPESIAGVAALRDSPDRLFAIVGEYWGLHMAAHRGSFDAEALLALATEARALIERNERQWLVYALGRFHFDSLRHHYLAGGTPTAAIGSPQRRNVSDFLRTRLPIHEAMRLLYTQAHLVGHVLLPRLALSAEPPTAAERTQAGIEAGDAASVGALAAASQRLYQRARDEFWQYGDREAEYLRADLLNAEMVQEGADLDAVVVRLYEYQRFIDRSAFADIASYPHFYFLRWHMLKYYGLLLTPGTPDPRTAREHLAEARRHARVIANLDAKVGNEYGLMRAELLTLLLRGVEERLEEEELRALGDRMADRRYGSEARLLDDLAARQGISSAKLHLIFRFYPFVHQ